MTLASQALIKILLVDDDSIDRMSMQRALRASNRELYIIESATAQEALQLLQEQPFDAVLLDYQLPDGNGLEILKKLQQSNLQKPAVIMVSGYDDESLAEQCLLAGAQDFLLKDEVKQRHLLRAIMHARQRAEMMEQLRTSETRLRLLAEQDPLTQLGNRHTFDESLQACLLRAQRYERQFAVVMIDLDHFKMVNDSYGHATGDELLRQIAGRLCAVTRDSDKVCRIGGDEFAVLMPEINDTQQPAMLAERLLRALQQPVHAGAVDIVVTASIGIALHPDHGHSAERLMAAADKAMYRSKESGRNCTHHLGTDSQTSSN